MPRKIRPKRVGADLLPEMAPQVKAMTYSLGQSVVLLGTSVTMEDGLAVTRDCVDFETKHVSLA